MVLEDDATRAPGDAGRRPVGSDSAIRPDRQMVSCAQPLQQHEGTLAADCAAGFVAFSDEPVHARGHRQPGLTLGGNQREHGLRVAAQTVQRRGDRPDSQQFDPARQRFESRPGLGRQGQFGKHSHPGVRSGEQGTDCGLPARQARIDKGQAGRPYDGIEQRIRI